MQFIKASREQLEAKLAEEIKAALDKGPVVWLLPGGSNIGSVVNALNLLAGNNNDKLTLLFGDERFGEVDHPDSNYFQLKQAGLNLHGATFLPALDGSDLDETVKRFAQTLEELLKGEATVISFLGMGADGHIAGILPRSPAIEALNQWAVGYQAADFVRITMTPFALSHADMAIVGAFGTEKGAMLGSLADGTMSSSDQPAQILHHIPKVLVYNDQLDKTV